MARSDLIVDLVKGRPGRRTFHGKRDLVTNRPEKTFFQCVHVRGDPERRHILAYVEYFGCLRFVAWLSRDWGYPDYAELCMAGWTSLPDVLDLLVGGFQHERLPR